MSLSARATGPIAIDFGASAVRVTQRLGRGAWHCEVLDFPPRPRGQRPSAAEKVDAVRTLFRRNRFRGRRVVTALPVQELFVKNIRMPRMTDEELEPAVRFEALERIQGLDAEAEIRFVPAGTLPGRDDGQQEVLVFAATGGAVREHLALLGELGLESAGIDVAGLAALRPFVRRLRRDQDTERVTAVADIGRTGMRFAIARGPALVFARFFEWGGEALDGAVADKMGMSIDEAGMLRRQTAVAREPNADDDEQKKTVHEAIRPVWEQLGKEIGLCLRYYAVTFRGIRPEKVICVGGEAVDPFALDFLSHVVGTPCRAGSPLTDAGCPNGSPSGAIGAEAEWATSAGLAIKPVGTAVGAVA